MSTSYKKDLAMAKCQHQSNICKELRNLKNSNAKQFWYILNENTVGQQKVAEPLLVSYESLFQHFKRLYHEKLSLNETPSGVDITYDLDYFKCTIFHT